LALLYTIRSRVLQLYLWSRCPHLRVRHLRSVQRDRKTIDPVCYVKSRWDAQRSGHGQFRFYISAAGDIHADKLRRRRALHFSCILDSLLAPKASVSIEGCVRQSYNIRLYAIFHVHNASLTLVVTYSPYPSTP